MKTIEHDWRLKTRTLTEFLSDPANAKRDAPPVFDVVIVGSGYGGSVAAHVLSTAAKAAHRTLKVLLLERGKAFHFGDFPSTFAELPRELRVANQERGEVSNHEGLFDLHLGPDVAAMVANGVGGGSLINAGVMLDPDDKAVMEPGRTPILAPRLKKLLGDHTFKRARRLLGGQVLRTVAGPPQWVRNNADRLPVPLRKLQAFRDVAKDRGGRADAVDITVGLDGGPNHAGTLLNACNGCGDCMTGCNVGAKDSLDRNLLLGAQQRKNFDLDVVTGATVTSVLREERSRKWHWALRVLHTDARLQAREADGFRIRARNIVLAAGALGSPEILLRSRSDKLVFSPTLGESFSGNGDDIAAIYKLDQEVHSAADEDLPLDRRNVGPTTTARVKLQGAGKDDRAFLLEEFSVPGPMRRLFEETVTTGYTIAQLPKWDGDAHAHTDKDPLAVNAQSMAKTLLVGVIGHDAAAGSLRLARPERAGGELPQMGTLRIHWPDARWGKEMDAAHEKLRQFAEVAAKGKLAPTLVANPMWRLLPEGLDTLVSQPRGPVLTVHPLGGCRMGINSKEGVVDVCGRVFDADPQAHDPWHGSLVVLDGSIIGASLGVNPALSITALSLAAMDELLDNDVRWKRFGHPTRDPDTRPDEEALEATACMAPPLPPPASPVPTPQERTKLEIIERLVSGPIKLPGQKLVIVELTLAFEEQAIAKLIAPERVPMQLKPLHSRLRIYDAEEWDTHALKHLDDAEREGFLRFEARLSGSLRFLHRGVTGAWPRTLGGLRAWLCNRGKRDLWQRFADPFFSRQARAQKTANKLSQPLATKEPRGWFKDFKEFANLASHAGQMRLFEYKLKIGEVLHGADNWAPLLADGAAITGHKRLRYERRCNPWKQLTQMRLSTFPGLVPQYDAFLSRPMFELDARYLAKLGIPLLRVSSQRNHAEALAELMSFGMYMLRVLIDVHLWSFRKPDLREPREAYRLPPPLPAMPAPQITWIAVDKWPKDSPLEGQAVMVRLTRYPLPGRATGGKPLVMIHGYSASGTTFAHPSLEPSAAEYFWNQGRDVWVLDMRTSCGLESARYPWAMEQAGLIDIPAALLHVRNATGQKVDVLAHCIGGSMLAMALLTGADDVRSGTVELGVDSWLSTEHFGVLTAFNGANPSGTEHPTVDKLVLSQKGPVMRYTDENVLRAFVLQYVRRYLLSDDYRFEPSRDPGVAEQLLDRFLASLPYPREDFDRENPCPPWAKTPWVATRHRVDAIFGRTFTAANLNDKTLEDIDDFFGPMNLDTVSQTIHFARWDAITNQRGRGEFLTRKRIFERWGGIQTLALHGQDNGLVDPFTLRLLDQQLADAGVPLKTELLPHTGHQDALIGTGAANVFAQIEGFLKTVAPPPLPKPATPGSVAEACWLGPRLVMQVVAGKQPRVAVMSRPDQGRGTLWLVPVLEHSAPAGYTLLLPGAGPWVNGDAGGSDTWLFAEPAPYSALGLPPKTIAGWLCLVVYPLEETTARVPPSVPPTFVNARLAAPAAPVAPRNAQGAAMPIVNVNQPPPVYAISPPAFPLSVKTAAWMGAQWAAGTVAREPPEVTAVRHWLDRQPPSACREIFVRVEDVMRAGNLTQAKEFRFALASCQYPHGLFDRKPAGASLAALAKHADDVSLALMVGDQIYADATAGLVDPTREDELYELPHQRAFRQPEMRRVMQRMPVQMLLDDHELFDNWEPLPRGLPSDEDSLRLKRLRKKISRARKHGVAAYLHFQRMLPKYPKPRGPLDFQFEAGGHAFYMLDTRTERQRSRPSEPAAFGAIVGGAQQRQLEAWLLQHQDQVKFIATPSLFLPRRIQSTTPRHADACRADAWDGFPTSMRWLLAFIEKHELRKIVMLSGDEHHSLHSEIWVGAKHIKVLTVHSSALYAPYPFANGRPSDLMGKECNHYSGKTFDVDTFFVPPGDGFAVLDVMGDPTAPLLRIEYAKAGGSGAVSTRVPLI